MNYKIQPLSFLNKTFTTLVISQNSFNLVVGSTYSTLKVPVSLTENDTNNLININMVSDIFRTSVTLTNLELENDLTIANIVSKLAVKLGITLI